MSAAIGVAVGMTFLCLILTLVVTMLQEALATYAGWRTKELYAGIEQMPLNTARRPQGFGYRP